MSAKYLVELKGSRADLFRPLLTGVICTAGTVLATKISIPDLSLDQLASYVGGGRLSADRVAHTIYTACLKDNPMAACAAALGARAYAAQNIKAGIIPNIATVAKIGQVVANEYKTAMTRYQNDLKLREVIRQRVADGNASEEEQALANTVIVKPLTPPPPASTFVKDAAQAAVVSTIAATAAMTITRYALPEQPMVNTILEPAISGALYATGMRVIRSDTSMVYAFLLQAGATVITNSIVNYR